MGPFHSNKLEGAQLSTIKYFTAIYVFRITFNINGTTILKRFRKCIVGIS